MTAPIPVIGIPCDRRLIGPHYFSAAGEKYIDAVSQAARALPVLIPATPSGLDVAWILGHVDGILLTGSPSNVQPHHYAGSPSDPDTWHDPERDSVTLPLIPAAIREGVPVLGLCRGFQEINVALGGTLHQKVHEVPGHRDHRETGDDPLEAQYGPAHHVNLESDGLLRKLAGTDRLLVNSLHSQGVERLAPKLVVEATADDGLVEAFRVNASPAFAVGVQWHPEWRVMENPFSRTLFAAFGDASRMRRSSRK